MQKPCQCQHIRFAMQKTINEHTQANPVLYTIEKREYNQLPVSLAIAVSEAIQGQYNNTKTIKARADGIVKGESPVVVVGDFSLIDKASVSSYPI